MNIQLDPYFKFDRGERRGAVVILVIIATAFFFRNYLQKENAEYSLTEEQLQILAEYKKEEEKAKRREDSLRQVKLAERVAKKTNSNLNDFQRPIRYENFDPNIVGFETLSQMGVKRWQFNQLDKYRIAGGVFRTKKDFNKLYFVNDSIYRVLSPYLELPVADSSVNTNRMIADTILEVTKNKIDSIQIFSINTATVEELVSIKGVGDYRANLILRERDKLGGFVSVRQIEMLEKIPEEVIDELLKHIEIRKEEVRKLNLNSLNIYELNAHPYISLELAKKIYESRLIDGPYTSIENLLDRNLLDPYNYNLLKPYLQVNS